MAKKLNVNTFDFQDVMLVPQECQVRSRSEIIIETKNFPHTFKLPVVPANMSTVIDEPLAVWLAERSYFYVMHRFDVDAIEFINSMHEKGLFASISLGVQASDYEIVENFKNLRQPVEYVTIDIAHGDASSVTNLVETIKTASPSTFVIAGNVANPDAVYRLEAAGADAIKVGVAPGSACLTGPNTGFGSRGWQLSAIEWCAEASKDALIIADGGIRHYGDIAKALAFGADMVMIGGMFAAHEESPGGTVVEDGITYKEFFGSASAEQKGAASRVEGLRELIPHRGPLSETLRAIEENLQSAVSYAGGKDLESLTHVPYVML